MVWTPLLVASRLNLNRSTRSLSDTDAARLNVSPVEKADILEELNTELSVYLGMLYPLIEVLKAYDEFSDELSRCLSLSQGSHADAAASEFGSSPPYISIQHCGGYARKDS